MPDITVIPIGPGAIDVTCGDTRVKIRLPPEATPPPPSGPGGPPQETGPKTPDGPRAPDNKPAEQQSVPPYKPIPFYAFRGIPYYAYIHQPIAPLDFTTNIYTQAATIDHLHEIARVIANTKFELPARKRHLTIYLHAHEIDLHELHSCFSRVREDIHITIYVGEPHV